MGGSTKFVNQLKFGFPRTPFSARWNYISEHFFKKCPQFQRRFLPKFGGIKFTNWLKFGSRIGHLTRTKITYSRTSSKTKKIFDFIANFYPNLGGCEKFEFDSFRDAISKNRIFAPKPNEVPFFDDDGTLLNPKMPVSVREGRKSSLIWHDFGSFLRTRGADLPRKFWY